MIYDYREKRSVIILSDQLAVGIAMNVLGHLAIAIGARADESLMGRSEYVDFSGSEHVGISRYAVIVKKARPSEIKEIRTMTKKDSGILLADYPEVMLTTGHDDELASALSQQAEAQIDYLGVALFGVTEKVDALVRKFSLYK